MDITFRRAVSPSRVLKIRDVDVRIGFVLQVLAWTYDEQALVDVRYYWALPSRPWVEDTSECCNEIGPPSSWLAEHDNVPRLLEVEISPTAKVRGAQPCNPHTRCLSYQSRVEDGPHLRLE